MPDQAKGPAPEKGQLSPEEIAAFERRVHDLGSEIDRAQGGKRAELTAQEEKAIRGRGMAYGLRMSSELVAAILVGGLIGYALDRLIGTTPWLFLVFFMLGFAAGILNVTRAFQRMQDEIKRETGGDIGHSIPDDDD
jgi:ATP synthase protein I